MADNQDLVDKYYKLAKKADARMRALEKFSQDDGYAVATQWAYRKAQKDIVAFYGDPGDGLFRWNKRLHASDNRLALEARINAVESFLASETSTKQGINRVFKSKADTFNEEYGTKFKWNDLAAFFTSGKFDKLRKKFGSDDIFMKIANYYNKKESKIIEAIKKSGKKHVTTTDVLDEIYKRMMRIKPTIGSLQKDET